MNKRDSPPSFRFHAGLRFSRDVAVDVFSAMSWSSSRAGRLGRSCARASSRHDLGRGGARSPGEFPAIDTPNENRSSFCGWRNL